MTRVPTRTPFPSSKLIRILSDLALLDAAEPGTAFAEKLGLWVDYSDAIALSSALNASAASPSVTRAAVPAHALADEFARLRNSLESSITQREPGKTGRPRIERPAPDFEFPVKVTTAYEPYRRYYAAHQREMDLDIRQLRAAVRETLARTSPALKQLAMLDAALDKVLVERESKLLSKVPLLLKKRFEHFIKVHQQTLLDTDQADKPDAWMKEGSWLARFCHELEAVLLAELNVRLQPTLGLIEALQNEKT